MDVSVFFISDGTGITVENMGASLLSQFDQFHFNTTTIPYVNTEEKADLVIQKINTAYEKTGQKPLIFSSIVKVALREKIEQQSHGRLFDFLKAFLSPLEEYFHQSSALRVGRAHSVMNDDNYKHRIDAVNFALNCDDGLNSQHYQKADVILIGVSRCGKTPTSLYLALQFGIFAANYPFTEDDMTHLRLPPFLAAVKPKLFGLTIDADRLHLVRNERRPNSRYAALDTCKKELQWAETLFQQENIPHLNTTYRSIEELATRILEIKQIPRRVV